MLAESQRYHNVQPWPMSSRSMKRRERLFVADQEQSS